jgi:low affinity Fe/Cu permease
VARAGEAGISHPRRVKLIRAGRSPRRQRRTPPVTKKRSLFNRFAQWASRASGRPITFILAVLVIVVWGATGPMFKFDNTWQLVINTSTTIVTFLMVFLIQSTQNRDTAAVHVKLDELIRVTKDAHNALLDLEELSEHDLGCIRDGYEKLAAMARRDLPENFSDFASSPAKGIDARGPEN